MNDREAFEKWCKTKSLSTIRREHWSGLRYDEHIECMWEGWQAAIEHCAKICRDLSMNYGGVSEGSMATERGKLVFESMAAVAHNCDVAIREVTVL